MYLYSYININILKLFPVLLKCLVPIESLIVFELNVNILEMLLHVFVYHLLLVRSEGILPPPSNT